MDYINISLHLCPPDGCGFDGWLLLVWLRSSQALETDFEPQKETMVTDDEASLPELLVLSLTLCFLSTCSDSSQGVSESSDSSPAGLVSRLRGEVYSSLSLTQRWLEPRHAGAINLAPANPTADTPRPEHTQRCFPSCSSLLVWYLWLEEGDYYKINDARGMDSFCLHWVGLETVDGANNISFYYLFNYNQYILILM